MVAPRDETITKDVVETLYWDARVDASKVAVTVDDGHVTLSGTVPSYSARAAATEDAWRTRGVTDVDNQLKVGEWKETPSDGDIENSIRSRFQWDNDLFPYDIQVSVAERWVTLEGSVDAFWKKVRAEDLAFSMRGVNGVTNKIAVVPSQTISDERLAEQIVDALDRSPYVNVDDVNVNVNHGVVTLSGAVPGWHSKQAAYDIASFTHGVRHVYDHLIIRIPEETPYR